MNWKRHGARSALGDYVRVESVVHHANVWPGIIDLHGDQNMFPEIFKGKRHNRSLIARP
jgi:hypothetical protein